jgi:hypothetical protein
LRINSAGPSSSKYEGHMNTRYKTALITLSSAIVFAAALRPGPALAGGLPPVILSPASASASASVTYYDPTPQPSNPSSSASKSTNGFGGVAEHGPASGAAASVSGGADPGASASASAAQYHGEGLYIDGNGGAGVNYEFEVSGPSGADVPIDLSANLQIAIFGNPTIVDSGNGASATADLYVGSYGFESCNLSCNSIEVIGTSGPSTRSDPINQQILVPTDTVISVFLAVTAVAEINVGIVQKLIGPASASATADPTFQIDPGYAQAADYTLVFSPGLDANPGLAVPEAKTWVMIVLGFAGLGLREASRRPTGASPATRRPRWRCGSHFLSDDGRLMKSRNCR